MEQATLLKFEYAIGHQKTFLTHNRMDFEEISKKFLSLNKRHCGIIIAVSRRPYELALRVLAILNGVAADEMEMLRYI